MQDTVKLCSTLGEASYLIYRNFAYVQGSRFLANTRRKWMANHTVSHYQQPDSESEPTNGLQVTNCQPPERKGTGLLSWLSPRKGDYKTEV